MTDGLSSILDASDPSALADGQDGSEAEAPRRSRLRRDDRERMIVEEAIRFFGEYGLEGQTRALAERLGITQPLLYRYFPDKNALIARVYEEVMARRWRPEWEGLLRDRSRPLTGRLTDFYVDYVRDACENGWIRFVMFAGLKATDHADPFISMVERHVIDAVCAELRAETGLPPLSAVGLSELEKELAWGLHAAVVFIALRRSVFRRPLPADVRAVVAATVASFHDAIRAAATRATQQTQVA